MSRQVRPTTAPMGILPPRKRQREQNCPRNAYDETADPTAIMPACSRSMTHANAPQLQQQQQHEWFLPTHLSLLRALHVDDETTGANALDSCARPSWVEVNSFVNAQASVAERASQRERAAAVLRALGGSAASPPCTNSRRTEDNSRWCEQAEAAQAVREVELARADQAGGVGVGSPVLGGLPPRPPPAQGQQALGIAQSREQFLAALDPRSVVCSVLRRAVVNHETEHRSACAGLQSLTRRVDETVNHLASSLDTFTSTREDEATPWRGRHTEAFNAGDVKERHTSKLMLWRRLQTALSAFGAEAPDTGGRKRRRA